MRLVRLSYLRFSDEISSVENESRLEVKGPVLYSGMFIPKQSSTSNHIYKIKHRLEGIHV